MHQALLLFAAHSLLCIVHTQTHKSNNKYSLLLLFALFAYTYVRRTRYLLKQPQQQQQQQRGILLVGLLNKSAVDRVRKRLSEGERETAGRGSRPKTSITTGLSTSVAKFTATPRRYIHTSHAPTGFASLNFGHKSSGATARVEITQFA